MARVRRKVVQILAFIISFHSLDILTAFRALRCFLKLDEYMHEA